MRVNDLDSKESDGKGEGRGGLGSKFKVTSRHCDEMTVSFCFYLLCDVEVARVDAVCEQILCAAALTGAKHAVVGLEQLPAGQGGG